jgi:S1-C subfamily serine protease
MRNHRFIVLLCLISALIGALAASVWWNLPNQANSAKAQEPYRPQYSGIPAAPPPGTRTADANRTPLALGPAPTLEGGEELTPEERTNVAVYDACNRSVVNIKTEASSTTMFLLDLVSEGTGSGSVLDKKGDILTNYHVVEGAKEIVATLYDSKDYPARVLAKDASTDVAILKIDAPAESLYPVHFGDSTRLKVGQRIYAIGNPFGLERTLTTGVVSSLDRTLPSRSNRTIKSVIQVDAAINPGNSGGPLLDTHGRLIGMNTAIASKTGQNTGVGFAIPSSIIARVVPELIANGHVTRPDTGIVKVYETDKGLLIAAIQPGGPAEQAGLRGFKVVRERKRQGPFVYETTNVDRSTADIITAVNGKPTLTADDFLSVIDSYHPGDDVNITVIRDGHETQVRVHLAAQES